MEFNERAVWDNIFSHPDKARKTGGLFFYQLALERIRPGETICDAGCGYTFYLPDLMRRCGPRGAFVGIDFSSVVMAQNAEQVSHYPNAQLLLADIRQLPLPDGCVDRVLCAETLPYLLRDVDNGFKELARIARKEIVLSLHTRGAYEIKGTHNEFRGNVVVEHTPGAKPPRRLFEREEIQEIVQSVGHLRVETITPFRWRDLFNTQATGGAWPWYLPAPETVALYYVVAHISDL